MPGWKLPVGIVLVAAGTFLVLMSKEDMEAKKTSGGPKPATPAVASAPTDNSNPTPGG
jgi:hypothetical protein